MSIKMVSPRDFTLRTTRGHVIRFKANEPVTVADDVVSQALAVNIMPVEGGVEFDSPAGQRVSHKTMPGTLRDAVILRTIQELVKDNDATNFNAGGQPKLSVVNAATGVHLSGSELSKYWERYRELIGTNSPFPTHPKLENVVELQTLTTRKQLQEYAEENGIDVDLIKGKSTKAAKELLMAATVSHAGGAPAHVSGLVED